LAARYFNATVYVGSKSYANNIEDLRSLEAFTVASDGSIYVAVGNQIRKVDQNGIITVFANPLATDGYVDGQLSSALFTQISALLFDNGKLYVGEYGKIRMIHNSVVSTVAGNAAVGYLNGQGTAARLYWVHSLVVCASNIYFVDSQRIRSLNSTGYVSTIAGSTSGFVDGVGTQAAFQSPKDLACSGQFLYVADTYNFAVRKISISTKTVTTFAGGVEGFANGMGTGASFSMIYSIDINSNGVLYVTDYWNGLIRAVYPNATVTTFLGSVEQYGYKMDYRLNSEIDIPNKIRIDASGNIYIVEGSSTLLKVNTTGYISHFAGLRRRGYRDGARSQALFTATTGIVSDSAGNIFVSDMFNRVIRKIDTRNDLVSTFSGSGIYGAQVGSASTARFGFPNALTIDNNDNLYVSDDANGNILKVSPLGAVSHLAGGGWCDYADGTGTSAFFCVPNDITYNPYTGSIFVADTWNTRIRELFLNGTVRTIAGGGALSGKRHSFI
jgi:sugar lactone lactonase YvrE